MSNKPVRWLYAALKDLEALRQYVSQDDPETAEDIAGRIWTASQSLVRFPDRGRPGRVMGTRELVLADMPIILAYRVNNGEVQILRVIHTARNWPS